MQTLVLVILLHLAGIQSIQPEYVGLALKSQEALGWNWQKRLPWWHVVYKPAHPTMLAEASTLTGQRVITVWVRKGQTPVQTASAIAHELAHALDWDYGNEDWRKYWMELRGIDPSTPWEPTKEQLEKCPICGDYASGAGDFAESVAWTLMGPRARFRSNLGKKSPTEAQQALIREWLGIK